MANKAPVYTSQVATQQSLIHQLREACDALTSHAPCDLVDKLNHAVTELEQALIATVPIRRGNLRVGFGVDAAQKAIACDAVIAIAKQIKAVKSW